ncbi:MAG: DUF5677 domain-containing protein [Pseudomonadales bacterium]
MVNHIVFHEDCLRLFLKVRDLTRTVITPINPADSLQIFCATQLDFFSQRCITVSHLLKSGLFWDAEIVFRAAIESALKVLFVSVAQEPERSLRILEFREHLSQIAFFRFRSRASAGKPDGAGPGEIFSRLALSEDELAEHNRKWSKKERKALEQKWAFSEMIKELESVDVEGHKLSYLSNLVHSYGVASHFLHADQLAIDLSADREHRSPAVKQILEMLHFTEMLTRMVALLISCSAYVAFALGKKIDFMGCVKDLSLLNVTVENLRATLYDLERDLYHPGEN